MKSDKNPKPLIDEIFNANTLPSSPTDKCYEEFLKINEFGEYSEKYNLWQAAWQASRKECEEEIAFHQAERVKASSKGRNAVNISVEHIKENCRLREESEKWRIHYQDEAKRRCKLQEHIASLQSVVEAKNTAIDLLDDVRRSQIRTIEAKDEALKQIEYYSKGRPLYSLPVINHIAQAALHIDQSGGKKEEDV